MKTHIFRRARNLLACYPRFFTGCDSCAHKIPPLHRRVARLPQPEFPVDIVYTWVDGFERKHQIKRALYRNSFKKVPRESMASGRFMDNDELRYSLRSVNEFAPWVNRIFIVTDDQIPEWLNTNNSRIRIIDHRQILPGQALPTFNSHVIEAYLHLIPGLSEHYIYFNDDFFLTRPAGKNEFFTANGLPYVFTDWRLSRLQGYLEQKNAHARSFFNTLDILTKSRIPLPAPTITAHGPYAQSRHNAAATFERFKNTIAGFTCNKFRTEREVAFYCHAAPLYTLALHKSVPADVSYFFMNIKRFDRKNYYDYLLANRNSPHLPLFACFNDTTTDCLAGIWQQDLIAFLAEFFPAASEFENRRGNRPRPESPSGAGA